jgi:hypothetical protein
MPQLSLQGQSLGSGNTRENISPGATQNVEFSVDVFVELVADAGHQTG